MAWCCILWKRMSHCFSDKFHDYVPQLQHCIPCTFSSFVPCADISFNHAAMLIIPHGQGCKTFCTTETKLFNVSHRLEIVTVQSLQELVLLKWLLNKHGSRQELSQSFRCTCKKHLPQSTVVKGATHMYIHTHKCTQVNSMHYLLLKLPLAPTGSVSMTMALLVQSSKWRSWRWNTFRPFNRLGLG